MRFAISFWFVCLCFASVCCLTAGKESSPNDSSKLRAQSRADNAKKSSESKPKVDMTSMMQQHLIGAMSATAAHNDKELRDKSGSKEDGKKGRLQTVGSVLGDIIGALVSEIARFFGNVVSDVAREVTAHGFVSLLKQIADFTGMGLATGHGTAGQPASAQLAGVPQFG